jgi:hypothetical protein
MMYYCEHLPGPIADEQCKSQYGINPAAAEAPEHGFYPIVDVPEGYTASHYVKRDRYYEAIPLPISNGELEMVETLRKHKVDHTKLKQLVVPVWSADHTYQPGDEVQHNGRLYRKDNDDDQSVPDDVAGGWSEIR